MMKISNCRILMLSILLSGLFFESNPSFGKSKTIVAIKGDKWMINGSVINKGSPAEGLLMNVRMVNSVFEDRGDKIPAEYKNFDAVKNTEEFLVRIPEYTSNGVNDFTISLQGGMPGYEGAVNTAFESDGSLRRSYMDRVARVIREADRNSAVIILSCFYQRQHSHFSALAGKEAIRNAVSNVVKWIGENQFRNVILEISNEYRHGGYRNWTDGSWLVSTKAQAELMNLARSLDPHLYIGTSGMGDGQLNDTLIRTADYITVHFNNTPLEKYGEKISELRKTGKPVLCNEDDKVGRAGAGALLFSVANGCGWGFMHSRQNQTIPFRFEGISDDTATYRAMKEVTTHGTKIDKDRLLLPALMITSPNDGDIFSRGQAVAVRFSYIPPASPGKYTLKLYANDREALVTQEIRGQVRYVPTETGIIYLKLAVFDSNGSEVMRSPKVDILVK